MRLSPTETRNISSDDLRVDYANLFSSNNWKFIKSRDDDFDYLNCRGLAEVQAESVAFTVMKFLGLVSSDYSIAYIRGWGSDDFKEFKSSLKVIVETSQKIIQDLQLHEGCLDD